MPHRDGWEYYAPTAPPCAGAVATGADQSKPCRPSDRRTEARAAAPLKVGRRPPFPPLTFSHAFALEPKNPLPLPADYFRAPAAAFHENRVPSFSLSLIRCPRYRPKPRRRHCHHVPRILPGCGATRALAHVRRTPSLRYRATAPPLPSPRRLWPAGAGRRPPFLCGGVARTCWRK